MVEDILLVQHTKPITAFVSFLSTPAIIYIVVLSLLSFHSMRMRVAYEMSHFLEMLQTQYP